MSKAMGTAGRTGGARTGSRQAAAKRKRAAAGLETAPDGAVIGRDPRRLSPVELRELGHRGKPLLQAMRRRCVDCCGGKVDEVRRCTAVACPLWPYRMGTDPWRAEAARPEPQRRPPDSAQKPPAAVAAPAPKPTPERPPAAVRRSRRAVPPPTPLLPFLDDVSA